MADSSKETARLKSILSTLRSIDEGVIAHEHVDYKTLFENLSEEVAKTNERIAKIRKICAVMRDNDRITEEYVNAMVEILNPSVSSVDPSSPMNWPSPRSMRKNKIYLVDEKKI